MLLELTTKFSPRNSTEKDLAVFEELVRWNFEISRAGAFPDATSAIIVRAVARAEPAVEISSVGNWYAAEVGAHTNDHKPVGPHSSLCVRLRVAEVGKRRLLLAFNRFF